MGLGRWGALSMGLVTPRERSPITPAQLWLSPSAPGGLGWSRGRERLPGPVLRKSFLAPEARGEKNELLNLLTLLLLGGVVGETSGSPVWAQRSQCQKLRAGLGVGTQGWWRPPSPCLLCAPLGKDSQGWMEARPRTGRAAPDELLCHYRSEGPSIHSVCGLPA